MKQQGNGKDQMIKALTGYETKTAIEMIFGILGIWTTYAMAILSMYGALHLFGGPGSSPEEHEGDTSTWD